MFSLLNIKHSNKWKILHLTIQLYRYWRMGNEVICSKTLTQRPTFLIWERTQPSMLQQLLICVTASLSHRCGNTHDTNLCIDLSHWLFNIASHLEES